MQVLFGKKICLTGVDSAEEHKSHKLIKSLNGLLTNDLTKDTYCLLVKKVGSKKYQIAKELGIPTLQIQWLADCYSTAHWIKFFYVRLSS
jgi:NAD-dependent DNA ligase